MLEVWYSTGMLHDCPETACVHLGDCLDVLRTLPDCSVDAVITDPPYGLEFMGKAWDRFAPAEFQAWCEKWAAECLRVLKPGGHLLAFGGTRTWHRLTAGVEDAGSEIRDTITWLYGSGFPKSRHALKPASEPIIVARKPLAGTVAQTVLAYGTGTLNIAACRVATPDGQPAYVYPNGPGGKSMHYTSDERGARPNASQGDPAGRWPANVILSHAATPDGEDLCTVCECGARGPHEPTEYCYDQWSDCVPGCPVAELDAQAPNVGAAAPVRGTEPSAAVETGAITNARARVPGAFHNDSGGASRFFPVFRYQAKAPARERPKVDGVAHPTVKPLALVRWLVRLVCPPAGIVLDPFAGSGTTIEACLAEDVRCIAIEREVDYLPLIHHRLERARGSA